MKDLSDEKLEKLLNDYCASAPEQSFVYTPAEKKEKIIPFALTRRAAAAAASVVFISVLSMTVYFLLGNKIDTPIAVAPFSQSATTPSAPKGGSADTDSPQGNDPASETEQPSALQRIFDSVTRWIGNEQTPSNPGVTPALPGGGTSPAENSAPDVTEKPSPQPTEIQPGPTDAIKDGPGVVEPTDPHTPPRVDPTDGGSGPNHPLPDEPTESNPGQGDDPWLEPPTEGGGTMGGNLPLVHMYIETELLDGNNNIYCKIYDSAGRRLGSADLFDRTHLAEILYQTPYVTYVEYEIPYELLMEDDVYTFVFYDHNGTNLARTQDYD